MKVKRWAFLLIIAALACAVTGDAQTAKRKRATKSKRAATTQPAAKPQPAEPTGTAQPASQAPQAAQPKEVERITVEELKAKIEKAEPVFIIDSRSQGSYDSTETKIKGALRIPMDDVESRLSEIPHDKEIVVYCT